MVRVTPACPVAAQSRNPCSIYKGKYQISRRDFSHGFVEGIARTVGVSLRRPEIAARDALVECLILIDPPISHSDSAARDMPG